MSARETSLLLLSHIKAGIFSVTLFFSYGTEQFEENSLEVVKIEKRFLSFM